MPLGLYISVPFCKTKCSYCNFASDVFSKAVFRRYVDRVCEDLDHAAETAARLGGQFDPAVDSIFLGGGTPTVLETEQLETLFAAVHKNLQVLPGAEVTVECAPGTLSAEMVESFLRCGVNRVSLGVQSFVDQEAAAVGRVHKAATVAGDIRRLRDTGISNINVDLIAGLPHQTAESWDFSVAEAIGSGVPHVSVYMLEVDEDSRLGREVLAGGTRYHAHFVPNDDLTADLYVSACEKLNAAGVEQYEISNFARAGLESKHNLKYWTRQPYMGFGVDAHSMLRAGAKAADPGKPVGGLKAHASTTVPAVEMDGNKGECEVIRFSSSDSLEAYVRDNAVAPIGVSRAAALEETFFLGLRLNRGVDLSAVCRSFRTDETAYIASVVDDLVGQGLLIRKDNVVSLSARGRLLSNEAFERFIDAGR